MAADQPEPTTDDDWMGESWTWVPGDQDDTDPSSEGASDGTA